MDAGQSEILLRSLAGIGLFFFGIKTITRNLSAMAGDQFRRGLSGASKGDALGVLLGGAAGFITQSGRTTSFILASFVQAGMIEARRALPMVLWANFGCTLVIFSAVFPIQLFALFLIAVGGISIAFERPKPMLKAASATFGLALMLYGLQMMSSSTEALSHFHWFMAALAFIKLSLVFAFLMGLVLTFVAQSHIAIMLIAITMASRGVFDFDQTLMVIYGAHIGSSLNTYVMGVHFQGQPRQVVIGQMLYNLIAVVPFIGVLLVEYAIYGRDVWLQGLTHRVSLAPGVDAALAAVLLNLVAPVVLTLALPAFSKLCAKLAPPAHHEDLSHPQFLMDEVGDSAVATLILAEKEQLRLLKRLPAYCAWARGETSTMSGLTPRAWHDAFARVSAAVQRFQSGLMSQRMSASDTEWLLDQQKRQAILEALDDACLELCEIPADMGAQALHVRGVIVEAIDMFLLTAVDAMAKGDPAELDALETMTRNRGPAMEQMRSRYLAASDRLSADERNRILQLTSLLERVAWSLSRFATLLRRAPGFVQSTEPANAGPELQAAPANAA
jgi:phosphate:Na+ symporter